MLDRNAQSDSTPPDLAGLRVALAHDWLVARRGGELVLDAIAENLLRAGARVTRLYTMFHARRPIAPAIDALEPSVSSLDRAPRRARRWLLPLYPRAVDELSRRLARDHAREPIDLLISTSSAAIKNLRPPEGVAHLCYCHSPARYLWDQRADYATSAALPDRARAWGLTRCGPRLRAWDHDGARHVTRFIANSAHIASRIRAVYDRDSVVVHPPVRTDFFTPDDTPRTGALLVAGAIEPYKRADLAIEAARLMSAPIDIVGDGSAARALRRRYPPSDLVRWHGQRRDADLRDHFRAARALIQPQTEDFGILAVEAQACGCPVVARRAGGALDTVQDTRTGALFDAPEPDEIRRAIERLDAPTITPGACRAGALRFSRPAFDAKLAAVIDATLAQRPGPPDHS